jgi:hypothetical protein
MDIVGPCIFGIFEEVALVKKAAGQNDQEGGPDIIAWHG